MSNRYLHDCSECKYLGSYEEYDLYYCTQGGYMSTVIARYNDDPFKYYSGLAMAKDIPALAEAKKLAIAQGYLS